MSDYDYPNFDSNYLCPHCGGLIYLDTANPPNNVCINSKCPLWPQDFDSIIDATEEQEPQIYREINEKKDLLIGKIHSWKPRKLARYAYKARRELITPLFTTGILPSIQHFIAAGELLLLINKYSSAGKVDNIDEFRQLLEDVRKWSQDQRHLEDIRNRRIVFGRTKLGLKPLSIKYSRVIAELQQGHGVMNSTKLPPKESLFPYEHLEASVTPKPVDFSAMTDFTQILDSFWVLSLSMRYWLQEHHRTKIQYNYTPDLLDFTVFCGWLYKTWGRAELHIIPTEKLEKETREVQSHFDSQSDKGYSAQNFFNTYVDSTKLVPIVARTSEGIIVDYHTLLFFLIYLYGCPDPEEPALKKRGEIIQNMKGRVSKKFENWLREEIRNKGYEGPDRPIKVPLKGYEYDIIAISERRKTIVVADAKYRDMSPSSFTGYNLISQELLGDHALRYEADLQQKRTVYFRNNLEKFREYLNPKLPWGEYSVESFVVTKQTPLAHRYKDVKILRATDFLYTVT